jgi:hypothetical protein
LGFTGGKGKAKHTDAGFYEAVKGSLLFDPEKRLVKLGSALVFFHKKPWHAIHVFEYFRIERNPRLMKSIHNLLCGGRAPFDRNHLLDIGIVFVGLVNAFS